MMKMKNIVSCNEIESPLYHHEKPDVQWTPSWKCNFACKYCEVKDNTDKPTKETMYKVLDFINLVGSKKRITVSIYGGEPTIVPGFLDLMREIKHQAQIFILTNLTAPNDFLRELNSINVKIKIAATFHYDFGASIEKYIEKLGIICERPDNIIEARIMIHEGNKKETKPIFYRVNDLMIKYKNMIAIPKLVFHDNFELTDDLVSWSAQFNNGQLYELKDDKGNSVALSTNEIQYRKLNFFKYFRCYCGPQSLVIDSEGTVFYCDTYRGLNHRPILNILDGGYEEKIDDLIIKPMICDINYCPCEFFITKERVMKFRGEI